MELTATNRSQAYPEKAERAEQVGADMERNACIPGHGRNNRKKFAEQTERVNGVHECSEIEADR